MEETKDNLFVKLYKYLAKENGAVVYRKYLTVTYNNNPVFDGEVNFDKIESFHRFDNDNIICPKGKYHPTYFYSNTFSTLSLSEFKDNGDWELKCISHEQGYFLVFYLMNGESHFFYKKAGESTWGHQKLHSEIYGVKLKNEQTNYEYPLAYVVKEGNEIQLIGAKYTIKADGIYKNDCGGTVNIMNAGNNTRGCFENNYDHFYFLTYTNTSDFACGYYDSQDSIDYLNIEQYSVTKNEDSPLEFVDQVQIEEIKFIYNYKYAYYTIKNLSNGKKYRGIIDTKKNIVVFNTDKEILTYVPYSDISMLAITSTTAYEICVIKKDGDCIDSYGCVDTGNNYIVDLDGNKCANSCEDGKIFLIRENMCSNTCDESIYVLNGNQCGLCKQLFPSTPYKLINAANCLSEANIPVGAEVYNVKLYLLKCKSGYKLEGETCVVNCYETCATCSEYSEDITDQKCLTCKADYIKENGNCITPPTTIINLIPTTIPNIIPSTIPTIIPTTINVQIPSTILTTIPTPIQTTLPTKILTTIPTTVSTTIPPIYDECNDEKCLTCNEKSNILGLCLTCNEAKGYKKVNYTTVFTEFYDCILNTSTILSKYFFNETTQEYRPCYKTCKKCLKGGDDYANNCLECENGYMLRPGDNPHNNCVVYSDYYYISPYNQYKALDSFQCPEESKYMVKADNKSYCIYDCKYDNIYKYLYNGICLKECPKNTHNVNYICQEMVDKCNLVENKMDSHIILNQEATETMVRTYISEFNYTTKHISLYTNNNYSIIIYESRDCINELSLDMPKVDFKDCYEKVQREYDINTELIIAIIDKKGKNNGQTYYSFFHPESGYKLNAEEICKNEKIIVNQNLSSLLSESSETKEKENLILQTYLTDQGINIFDLNNPFYTDLCFDFDNPSDRDIPLSERISTIYPDVTLCDTGCHIDGIDLESMTASCDCKFNDISNNNVIKESAIMEGAIGEVLELINESNILVMKCYKYIFKHFKKSIGGIISTISISIHLICTLLYYLYGKNQIRMYIFDIYENCFTFISKGQNNIKNIPPKKSLKNERLKDRLMKNKKSVRFNPSEKEKEYKNEKYNHLDTHSHSNRRQIKIEKPKMDKIDNKSTHKEIIQLKNNSSEKTKTDKDNIAEKSINKSNVSIISKKINKKKYTDINSMIKIKDEYTIKSNTKEDNYQQFFDEYLSTSLDDMEFDDAIVKDKRTFCEYLTENLKEKQMIAFTFIAKDPLKIRIIKIMLFLLTFVLYFVVIGLFYSEEYIDELYNIDSKEEGFFDFIPRSIDKFIYTTFVSIIISYIIECFFIEEKKIKGIFKREKDNMDNLRNEIVGLIKEIQKRYLSFIIVILVILLISFYYLLCFNYVYPKTQIEWAKASLTIFVIMQILSALKCLLQTCLRFLSFRYQSEKLFKISKFLD